MTAVAQRIQTLQEELDKHETEKFGLFEAIREIQERQKAGKIYGNEALENDSLNRKLRKLIPQIGTKQRELTRLKTKELGNQQTAFAL